MANANPYMARITKARKRIQKIDPAEIKEVRQALTMATLDLVSSLGDAWSLIASGEQE